MTQRERQTADAAAPAPPALTGAAAVWEEIFQSVGPTRRQELLDLAGRQGVLYAHQLPATNGGAKRTLLPALLNGQTRDLPPLRPTPVACQDACLDAGQRDAVARALQTPDLCLIQGHPGSGKSRTAAEIAALAAARGERVLLLAPTAAAVDCVLGRLDGRDDVCAARCLSPGEQPEALPPGLRRLVFEERLRAFHEQTLPAAKQAAAEAARRLAVRRADESVWNELEDLARRREEFAEEGRRLAERTARIEEELEAEASGPDAATPFRRELEDRRRVHAEALARIDARLAELRAEAEKVRGEQQAAADEAARLRPLAEARRGGHWLTVAWWRARGEGDLLHRLEEVEKRQAERKAAAERLAHEVEEQVTERGQAEARDREETVDLRRREGERRRTELDQRRAALDGDIETLEEKGRATSRGLSEGAAPPRGLSAVAVREAREAWRSQLEKDERQAALAAQWADAVQKTMDTWPERLARCVNVVGAVTTALPNDPRFGDRASPRVTFDLLILEESHLVTESEFLAAARRSRRWVLIGEPSDEEEAHPPSSPRGGREGRGGPSRPPRPSTLRPGFFQRLWRLLHADPARLPYAWFHREGRLVCRVRPAEPNKPQRLVSEHLADRPEIELGFAAPPRMAPQLIEVAFPGSTTIQEAKAFIFRELGELAVQARGGGFRWGEDAERLVLDLSDGAVAHSTAVRLAEGVCEWVGEAPPAGEGGACWQTCSLEFDRAAGWTRERAEQWVGEHLQTPNLGRTVLLNAPHRARPALARFLSGLLFDGACAPRLADDGPAVEFVAVPTPDGESVRRRPAAVPALVGEGDRGGGHRGAAATAAPRLRASRGGAGLEVDLADARRLDPVPSDLRAALPRQGLVNVFEARAVVRKLEELVADPAFRAAAEEWACHPARGEDGPKGPVIFPCSSLPRPALAVIALYPAQADLIRVLASQSAVLAAAPVAVEIGTPDAFRCRECFTALISLTRSHSHRAVPFGGDPSWLPTALTRAASRLVLFGDPGTLARRAQWNGPVEHLDETAAERERGRIAQLVAYLHGAGPHPNTFGLEESGRV